MTITIKDGIGVINGEPVSTDVDYADDEIPSLGYTIATRRFRIDCGNGYKLSVVFGGGSYSDNHDALMGRGQFQDEVFRAEIGVLGPEGLVGVFSDEWGDDVKGYATAGDILAALEKVRALPAIESATV